MTPQDSKSYEQVIADTLLDIDMDDTGARASHVSRAHGVVAALRAAGFGISREAGAAALEHDGQPCTLGACRPGLFIRAGTLGFRTEYKEGNGAADAYCLDSGKFFWAGTSTGPMQAALIVQPVRIRSTPQQATPAHTAPLGADLESYGICDPNDGCGARFPLPRIDDGSIVKCPACSGTAILEFGRVKSIEEPQEGEGKAEGGE